jgi:adenylate kinase
MEERRGQAPGFLIDGFPRTMEQAKEFESKIGKCKFVLFFDASAETLTQRLLKRGETSGRADDNLESIQKRLVTFREASMPVVEYFETSGRVKKVMAEGDIEDITKATLGCFEGI